MNDLEIVVVEPSASDLLLLIKRLDEELLDRYPAQEVHGINFEDPKTNEIVFVVAYLKGTPVGCGAIRPLDHESTELKRFFVERAYRQMGIAARILTFVEERARILDFKVIKLETGIEQPEAIKFYKKHGYEEIEKFGEYKDCEMSLCYEKRLA